MPLMTQRGVKAETGLPLPASPHLPLSLSEEHGVALSATGSTWQSWTMVTTGVPWLTAPIDAIMAYSRSA